jgi:hypothetical protein
MLRSNNTLPLHQVETVIYFSPYQTTSLKQPCQSTYSATIGTIDNLVMDIDRVPISDQHQNWDQQIECHQVTTTVRTLIDKRTDGRNMCVCFSFHFHITLPRCRNDLILYSTIVTSALYVLRAHLIPYPQTRKERERISRYKIHAHVSLPRY